MAFEAQIDKLIDKLTELTRADKVVWQETAAENTFLTGVGETGVTVGRVNSNPSAPCFIRILDATGKTIEEAYAPNLAMPDRDIAIKDMDRLRSLLELARRSALKSEKVVSDLLSSLEALK
jgi:hypothetical protein